jgi:hypothetical protein
MPNGQQHTATTSNTNRDQRATIPSTTRKLLMVVSKILGKRFDIFFQLGALIKPHNPAYLQVGDGRALKISWCIQWTVRNEKIIQVLSTYINKTSQKSTTE